MQDVLRVELGQAPCPTLSKPTVLARTANHTRQKLRPQDPVDLEFQLSDDHIPEGYLQADIKVVIIE